MGPYFKIVFQALLLFFVPIIPMVFLVGMFVIADTIVGLIKAKRNKENITSLRLADIIPKLLGYTGLLLLSYCLDFFLLGEFTLMYTGIALLTTKAVAFILIYIEIFSIDESIRKMNKDRGIIYYVKRVITVLRKIKRELTDFKK